MHDPKQKLERYEKAKAHRQNFVDLFEECYEFALPQRESFYFETAGQRRDDKIFDETAVVGVQEFASRLQSGLVPNFARWADLISGSEVPKEERDFVDNDLDEITEYVFEILQNSNFSQEVHEAFMDCAIGTGVMLIEEGDALNPIKFTAIPLPKVMLNNGPDNKVDTVFRKRKISEGKFRQELKFAIADLMRDLEINKKCYGQNLHTDVRVSTNVDMWDDAYASKRYLSHVIDENNLEKEKKYSMNNGMIDSLQNKYSNIIKINTDMFEKIEITSTDMLVTERGLPYPFIVPSFPIITSDDKLDYGSKMN